MVMAVLLIGCKPEDRTKGLVCEMSATELRPIINDLFIYEAARGSKSLDSLTQTYQKEAVLRAIYKKHNTSREKVQKAIECLTETKEMVPLLEDLKSSYKNWKENPELNTYESTDTVQ